VTKKLIFGIGGTIAAWFDKNVVDGVVNFSATVGENFSDTLKKMQNGKVQSYAMYFFTGVLGFVLLFVFLWDKF
jgi:NADH-quinone oxidoreductase subunit L